GRQDSAPMTANARPRRWRQWAREALRQGGPVHAAAVRWREIVLLSALAGAATGLAVALFERVVVDWIYDNLTDLSPWVLAWMPLCGLVLAAVALRWIARGASPDTTDAYLQAF